MPSLQDLPIELVQKIAPHLNNEDLLNLSLTSKTFLVLTEYEWMKRVKARWANGKEVFFRVCETGAIQAAAELVTKANADPNTGLATTCMLLRMGIRADLHPSAQPYVYPRLGSDVQVISADSFCLDRRTLMSISCLVNFNGRADSVAASDHFCCTRMLFPLHVAAAFGQVKIVDFLASQRSVPRRTAVYDRTDPPRPEQTELMISPLYLEIINKHPAVADLLIRSGASLNLLYHEGTEGSRVVTPFHLAVGVEGTEMVNFLIERGLYSLDEVNYAGLPPIWIAYLNKNWEAVDLLVRLGANINHNIARGFTPLAHALFIDKYEAVKKLIAAGADKHIPFVEAPESFRFHPWWECDLGSAGESTPLEPLDFWINNKFCNPAAAPRYADATEDCEFIAWLVANNEIDLEKTSPDGVALSTKLFERRRTPLSGFLSQPLDSRLDWVLRNPGPWRLAVLERFLELGADPMARDSFGNTLLDLCLMDVDLDAYLCVSKYTPHSKAHFAQYCSVDGVMKSFAWTRARSEIDADGTIWELFVRQCLENLLALGLTTESEITHHPDFSRLLCESLKNGRSVELSEFLIGLKPPVSQLMTPCDGKTPFQHGIAASPSLVELLLAAGVNPDLVPEGAMPVLPIVQALHTPPTRETEYARTLETLVRRGADVHIDGSDSSNPIIEAINAMNPDRQNPQHKGFHSFSNSHKDYWLQLEHYWRQLEHMLVYHPLTERSAGLEQRYIRAACEGSHPIALRLLLIYGADPDCILEDGYTPLMYLLTRMFNDKRTWESCFPLIKQLTTFGASLDKISGPNDGSDPASPRGYLKQLISQILYDDPASLTDRYSCRHYLFRHGSDDYGGFSFAVQGEDIVLKIFRHAFYPERYPVPVNTDPHDREHKRKWCRAPTMNGILGKFQVVESWGGPSLDWKTMVPIEQDLTEEEHERVWARCNEIKPYCGYDDVEVIAEGWGGLWDRCITRLLGLDSTAEDVESHREDRELDSCTFRGIF